MTYVELREVLIWLIHQQSPEADVQGLAAGVARMTGYACSQEHLHALLDELIARGLVRREIFVDQYHIRTAYLLQVPGKAMLFRIHPTRFRGHVLDPTPA